MYLEIKGHELFIYQVDKTISLRKSLSDMEELLCIKMGQWGRFSLSHFTFHDKNLTFHDKYK